MDLLSGEEVSEVARKVAGSRRVEVMSHVLCGRSEESLGYLGKHLSLTLELSSREGEYRRAAFVKTYDSRPEREDFLGESGIFEREQDFYRVVVEDVKELIGEPDWCPQYYFSKVRVLVLEDLSEGGFRMAEDGLGQWGLDKAHLETALRTLASMHATSISLEHRQGHPLTSTYPSIFDRELIYDEEKPEAPTRKWIRWQTHDLLQAVDHLQKYSPQQKKLIRDSFEDLVMRIYTLSKTSLKYRNVVTHGDMWKNNLLFRYSEDGAPVECRFVDFQFVRYAPPAHDVMHLLHFALNKSTRDELESHFLGLYHEELLKQLERHGMDAQAELTKEELEASCKEYKELALMQCLLSLHYILGSVTLNADTKTYEEYEDYLTRNRRNYVEEFFKRKSYADKITDIFQEFIDRYVLRDHTTRKHYRKYACSVECGDSPEWSLADYDQKQITIYQ